MAPWVANFIALLLAGSLVWVLALALLWRLGSWLVRPADALIEDEGLPIGSEAPQVAAHSGDDEFHLAFLGQTAFVVFGVSECDPCRELLSVAAKHPATSHMRLVYLSDSEHADVEPAIAFQWETYRLHDNIGARKQWHAPVSPYFHVVDETGSVRAKGVANRADHLDRLLALRPPGTPFETNRYEPTIVGG